MKSNATHSRQVGSNGAETLADFRPVVVLPTYNNALTLLDVLGRTAGLGLPMIVVNDGSTDATPELLRDWLAADCPVDREIAHHSENQGKASALRTGFDHARKRRFTHAVTMDTDAQLDPAEIPRLLDAARPEQDALVLGSRSEGVPDVPRANRVAWSLSTLGIWLEIGRVVRDSQCGLRVYPLHLFDAVPSRTRGFMFEGEIVTRAVWAGCPLVEVPVSCRYFRDERRVSHIKPVRDGVRGFFLRWKLTIRRLIPWPAKRIRPRHAAGLVRRPARKEFDATAFVDPRWLGRKLRRSRADQLIVSAMFAGGVFWGVLPLGWLTWPVAIYAAWRLHFQLWPVLVGTLVALPPMGDWLTAVSNRLGAVLLPFVEAAPMAEGQWLAVRSAPATWIGSIPLAFVAHWLVIGGLCAAFALLPVGLEPDAPAGRTSEPGKGRVRT